MDTPHKYLKPDRGAGTYVSYLLLDKDGGIIRNDGNIPCFTHINYNTLAENVAFIKVYQSLKTIPYDIPIIKKWIAVLNRIGFSCELSIEGDTAYFTVDLAKHSKKVHLSNTLCLIRTLWHSGICHVPDYYFSMTPAQRRNPFLAVQEAHKLTYKNVKYLNSNHMACYEGANVSKEVFWDRMSKLKRGVRAANMIYGGGYESMSEIWHNP